MSLETSVPGIWEEVLAVLRNKVSAQQFQTWLSILVPQSVSDEGDLTLEAPNAFCCDWVNRRYGRFLDEAVRQVTDGKTKSVRLVEGASSDGLLPVRDVALSPPPAPAGAPPRDGDPGLNKGFTFDQFAVGAGNRLAAAAAEYLAAHDQAPFNPLYIHGPVGVGKTHLAQAICAASKARNPSLKIRLATGEQFTNEFITALEQGALDAFRARYREVDLLVIDDVHFLAGKDKCQEEFLYAFNAVKDRQRQLVLAAPAAPMDLEGIQERLRSRLSSGMVCHIEPPDRATREAIVDKRLRALEWSLPEDVRALLADQVSGNARELEGAVTRLMGHAVLLQTVPTVESARLILRDLIATRGRAVTIGDISDAVGRHYSVRRADMVGPARSHAITLPRHVSMYLARQLTGHSLEEIGRFFGKRDHSTVLYGVEKIAGRCAREESFRQLVERLSEEARSAT